MCIRDRLIDDKGYITEGSSSNAWILKNNTLITRPISNSILNGITRTSLIKSLKLKKLKIKERPFNLKDIRTADEAFITSATQFVMPVIRVDNIKIGNGKVGKNAELFKNSYMEAVQLK